jgi:hypothetical protein
MDAINTELQQGERKFAITPKTSNAELVAAPSITDRKLATKVANDIIANARELQPGVPWDEIVPMASFVVDESRTEVGKQVKGHEAIIKSAAKTIGSLARDMGLSMDAPAAVYMGGAYFGGILDRAHNTTLSNLKDIEEGTTRFTDDIAREVRTRTLTTKSEKIGGYREKVNEALGAYTEQYLPDDPEYIKALRDILYTYDHEDRAKAIDALKERDSDQKIAA